MSFQTWLAFVDCHLLYDLEMSREEFQAMSGVTYADLFELYRLETSPRRVLTFARALCRSTA
jgi:hypothetical protein